MRNPSKRLLAARATFNAAVGAIAVELGAMPLPDHYTPAWQLVTPLGPLTITPLDNWIACRFDKPEIAKRYVDCNPYSGKWNFHEWEDSPASLLAPDALEHFTRQLRRVLAFNVSAAA